MLLKIFIYTLPLLLVLPVTRGNAQIDLQVIEFHGKVHENGKGIKGGPVTDGIKIALTDNDGKFKSSNKL